MSTKRVAVARVWQETNSFSQRTSTLADFQRSDWFDGEALLKSMREREDELAGFADVLGPAGVEIVPLISASCWPGGPAEPELTDAIFARLDAAIAAAGPVDGVLISLHGAMSSDSISDIEGEMLNRLRSAYGPDMPIVATLDHHANVTTAMVGAVDSLTAYRQCPHIDTRETGARGAQQMLDLLAGRPKPVISYRKLPLVTPCERFMTGSGPMAEWFGLARADELSIPGIRDVSLFPVQPWLDVHEFGWSVVVVSDGKDEGAELADRLARHAWDNRDDFYVDKLTPAEAIMQAASAADGPVVLADGADATNGGSPGDSTALLTEMLEQQITCTSMLTMVDPDAVAAAYEAGEGAEITLDLGAGTSTRYHRPLHVTARVTALKHGRFSVGGHITAAVDVGRMAVLSIGSIHIVVSEHAGPGHDPAIYRHVGLEPKEAQIVVVKCTVGHMEVFKPIMKQSLAVEAPGPSPSYLDRLDYRRAARPLYPLERGMEWHP